jgi:hypothetical protein
VRHNTFVATFVAGSTPVNLASMPHGQSEDYESFVLNVADDTVVADAVTP